MTKPPERFFNTQILFKLLGIPQSIGSIPLDKNLLEKEMHPDPYTPPAVWDGTIQNDTPMSESKRNTFRLMRIWRARFVR